MSLEIITATAFAVHAEGFEPGEWVQSISKSGNETIADSVRVLPDSTPEGKVIVSPGVRGRRGGTATYTFIGRRCRVEVTYPWGNALRAQ